MTTLDVNFIRQQFPAFTDPDLQGWGFFENAGGSYPCRQVIERLNAFYQKTKVQPYGPYPVSAAAGAKMDEAYTRLAGYLNVDEDEIHFGPSTSQNTYVLAQAFRPLWQDGDEIVVTNQDHEANSGAWRRLSSSGIVVREWPIDQHTGVLNPADLDHLLNENTRLVAFPHASNIIGHINPVSEIAAKAHQVGAVVVVDGVSYAPHGFPDIDAMGADIYLFSLYKTFGPHQGLMVVRRPILEKLTNQSHYFNASSPRKKLIPAGPDHAQIAAAAGIADYFDAVYAHHFQEEVEAAERGRRLHTLFRQTEQTRLTPLLGWLNRRDDVQLVGPDTERAPTVAIISKNKKANFLARELAEHKIMANSGHFYAVRVLEGMGIPLDPGVLRLSFVHYTNEEEVTQLIEALDAVL
ncbi:MAG: aminotransferase class V-fold PLP-dependent enzyme [Ardenticatenaceae bacterium]|nr:aminotransferase class V-fold PLP-dependent enzyme [Ardenticatenaceae bacterium]